MHPSRRWAIVCFKKLPQYYITLLIVWEPLDVGKVLNTFLVQNFLSFFFVFRLKLCFRDRCLASVNIRVDFWGARIIFHCSGTQTNREFIGFPTPILFVYVVVYIDNRSTWPDIRGGVSDFLILWNVNRLLVASSRATIIEFDYVYKYRPLLTS